MPLTYHDILAAVALRINALEGTDPAALQETYATRPLTNSLFVSSAFPFNGIRDAIIQTEGRIAQVASKSADRVLRSYIGSQTVPLASGDELPTLDENGVGIIGEFGAVIDADNQAILCTRMPIPVVRRRNQAPDLWLLDGAMYALDGTRIIHTQENVFLECCVYDGVTQTTAFDQDSTILFPDALADLYIEGACGLLFRDDEFMDQAGRWATYFATGIAAIPAAQMEAQPA